MRSVPAVILATVIAGFGGEGRGQCVLPLGDVNGANGFSVAGLTSLDPFGEVVGPAGDLNGDGIGDLVVGRFRVPAGGFYRTAVIFGRDASGPSPFPAQIDVGNLDGSNGFAIVPATTLVAPGGDVNGDGVDDLIAGVNVIFGRDVASDGPFPAEIQRNAADGVTTIGFTGFTGLVWSAAGLGDVSGDGVGDIAFVSRVASGPGVDPEAHGYVFFGQGSGFGGPNGTQFDLSTHLDGVTGFRLEIPELGAEPSLFATLGARGDINHDGVNDVFLARPGRVHTIYGRDIVLEGAFPASLSVEALGGGGGFSVISSDPINEPIGGTVDAGGDLNGDGVDDMVFSSDGSPFLAYAFFGRDEAVAGAFPEFVSTATLDGLTGFVAIGDLFDLGFDGRAIARDFNGDGIDDVLLNGDSRRSYLLYGRDTPSDGPFPAAIDVSALDGTDGFLVHGLGGADGEDVSSLAPAGDVNGDSLGDLIFGQIGAFQNAGGATIVYGTPAPAFPPAGAPTPVFPNDGATGVGGGTQFNWTYGYAAETYLFEIDDDPAFQSPLLAETVDPIWELGDGYRFFPNPGLPLESSTQYFWRVSASNCVGPPAVSHVFSFTSLPALPGVFGAVSPADGAEDVPRGPLLEWTESADATRYNVEVRTSIGGPGAGPGPVFSAIVFAPATSVQIPADLLDPSTVHFWLVEAQNATGTTVWSDGFVSFTTDCNGAPLVINQFSLTDPPDLSAGVLPGELFDWSFTDNEDFHVLEFDTDPSFALPDHVVVTEADGYTLALTDPLLANTQYAWRVTAENCSFSRVSDTVRTFTTGGIPPAPFARLAPADGQAGVPTSPLLEWEPSFRAETYLVEVDVTANFTSPIVSASVPATETTLQIASGALDNDTTYRWRVTAQSVFGTAVSTGSAWRFTTAAPFPCVGDINGDGETNVFDFSQLAVSFGTSVGEVGWREEADLNDDQTIDVFDFGVLAGDFGCVP